MNYVAAPLRGNRRQPLLSSMEALRYRNTASSASTRTRTAVMLTKLSLWINSAMQDEPFVTIDTHVKCGNSLVLPWEIEFAEVFEEQGGFDLVVGNPPWGADLTEIREYLDGGPFTLARGQYDSYELFIELGRRLLREGGMFGFIIPDSITLPEHEPLRRMLLDQTALTRLVRAGEGIFPSVFRAVFFLCFANQPPPPEQRIRVGTLRKAHRKATGGRYALRPAEIYRGPCQRCRSRAAAERLRAEPQGRLRCPCRG